MQATDISLTVREDNQKIIFELEDNGKGFNLESVVLGNGLENMKKRAKEINSELEVISTEKDGTQIRNAIKNRRIMLMA